MNEDRDNASLNGAFQALRDATANAAASSAVENNLRRAFQANNRGRKARQQRTARMWLATALAAVFSLVAVLSSTLSSRHVLSNPKGNIPLSQTTKPLVSIQPAVAKAVPRPRGLKAVKLKRPVVLPKIKQFVRVPYTPELLPGEPAQVLRVRLPRVSLQPLGMPVNAERMFADRSFDSVEADVLMGQDGIVRAVRLAK